jgi:hypothetical protein
MARRTAHEQRMNSGGGIADYSDPTALFSYAIHVEHIDATGDQPGIGE